MGAVSDTDEALGAAAFSGDQLPIVIVNVAYRLNTLGFLATSDLAAEQGGSAGNYGITDALLALKWVQSNIAAFGGDPARVTIGGQSSGGTLCYGLMSTALSRGLFTGVISLSGSENMTWTMQQKTAFDQRVVQSVGCAGGATVAARNACMRALPALSLGNATPPEWNIVGHVLGATTPLRTP